MAERFTGSTRALYAKVGDYSLVFVRRLVDSRLVTTVISSSIATDAQSPFATFYRVSALADLNGDGRMEVALSSKDYEGAGVAVYELQPDGSLPEVLASGCP